jgi:hypothetical protein
MDRQESTAKKPTSTPLSNREMVGLALKVAVWTKVGSGSVYTGRAGPFHVIVQNAHYHDGDQDTDRRYLLEIITTANTPAHIVDQTVLEAGKSAEGDEIEKLFRRLGNEVLVCWPVFERSVELRRAARDFLRADKKADQNR